MLLVTMATTYIMATLKMFLFKFKYSQIQYNSTYGFTAELNSRQLHNNKQTCIRGAPGIYEALS